MLPIVDRYIAKEIFQTLVAVTVVLLLIFISMRLVRYFTEVAAGNIPKDLVFTLLGIKTMRTLNLIVPFSLFLAVLLVLGRMYRDSEMTAFATGGIGTLRIMRTVMFIAVPLTACLMWMSLQLLPKVAQIEFRVVKNAEKNLEVTGISAGSFREATGGERIIYVEKVTKNDPGSEKGSRLETRNVFIYVKLKSRQAVFSAARGKIETNKAGERILVLENGYRYDGNPGGADYRITHYDKHAVKLISNLRTEKLTRHEAKPTSELLKSKDPVDIAELQWRISLPLSVFLLALLAVPISRVKPRQGRFGKLIIGFLFAVVFVYVMQIVKKGVATSKIDPAIGMWWLHGLLVLVIVFLVIQQQGFKWSMKRFIGGA
jgi:lipopolysaccharide export system permease protein